MCRAGRKRFRWSSGFFGGAPQSRAWRDRHQYNVVDPQPMVESELAVWRYREATRPIICRVLEFTPDPEPVLKGASGWNQRSVSPSILARSRPIFVAS